MSPTCGGSTLNGYWWAHRAIQEARAAQRDRRWVRESCPRPEQEERAASGGLSTLRGARTLDVLLSDAEPAIQTQAAGAW